MNSVNKKACFLANFGGFLRRDITLYSGQGFRRNHITNYLLETLILSYYYRKSPDYPITYIWPQLHIHGYQVGSYTSTVFRLQYAFRGYRFGIR